MSMIANVRRLADADISQLLREPELIEGYIAEEEEAPEGFGPFAHLDLDKAWHAIHYLLTGAPWSGDHPWNFIVAGGSEVGDIDVGYGPARVFTSAETRDISGALQTLPTEKLASRFNPAAMTAAEIYPEIWNRSKEEDDVLGYAMEYYDSLREFVAGAASAGEGLLIYLN